MNKTGLSNNSLGLLCLEIVSLCVFIKFTLRSRYFHTAEADALFCGGHASVCWSRTYVVENLSWITTSLDISGLINNCICLKAVHFAGVWFFTAVLTRSATRRGFNLITEEAVQGIEGLATITSTFSTLRLGKVLVTFFEVGGLVGFDGTRSLRLVEFIVTAGIRILSSDLSIMLLSLLHVLDGSLSNCLLSAFWNTRGRAHTHIISVTSIRHRCNFTFCQFSWSVTRFIISEFGALTNTVSFISTVMNSKLSNTTFECGRLELAATCVREAKCSNSKIEVYVAFTLVNWLNDLVTNGTKDLCDIIRGAAADLSNWCDVHGDEFFIKHVLVHITDVLSVLGQFEDSLGSGAVDEIVGALRCVKSIGSGKGSKEKCIYDTALVALGLNKFVASSPDLHSELDLITACVLLIFRWKISNAWETTLWGCCLLVGSLELALLANALNDFCLS